MLFLFFLFSPSPCLSLLVSFFFSLSIYLSPFLSLPLSLLRPSFPGKKTSISSPLLPLRSVGGKSVTSDFSGPSSGLFPCRGLPAGHHQARAGFFSPRKKIMTCMLILLPQAIPSSRSCDDAFGEVLASGALEGSNVPVPGEGLVHVNLALYPLITPLSLRLCLRCNISSFFLNCRFLLKIMRFFRCTIPSIHACPACAVPTELSVLESLPMLEHSSSWVRFLSLLVFYG